MGSREYIARLDLNKLVLYKNLKSESYGRMSDDHNKPKKIDFNLPFKVLLTDGVRLYEIYSSNKDKANENELYVSLDDQAAEEGIKRRRLQVLSDSQRNQQVPKHTQSKQTNQIEEFPLTGPDGDFVVSDAFFRVIIHQDTDGPEFEFDDSHLLHAYACGKIVSQSDVVFTAYPDNRLYNVREGLFTCNIFLSVGMLTLSCVFLNVSRSVTVVGVKWLHDDTEITGGLFLSSFKDHKSALFETPKGKAIKVTYGQLIPLLRSTFAVIDGSSFKFDASVVSSAHGGSLSVINSITFKSDDFFKENNFTKSRVIDGRGGGKMQVVVTMKPNVLDYNSKHA